MPVFKTTYQYGNTTDFRIADENGKKRWYWKDYGGGWLLLDSDVCACLLGERSPGSVLTTVSVENGVSEEIEVSVTCPSGGTASPSSSRIPRGETVTFTLTYAGTTSSEFEIKAGGDPGVKIKWSSPKSVTLTRNAPGSNPAYSLYLDTDGTTIWQTNKAGDKIDGTTISGGELFQARALQASSADTFDVQLSNDSGESLWLWCTKWPSEPVANGASMSSDPIPVLGQDLYKITASNARTNNTDCFKCWVFQKNP